MAGSASSWSSPLCESQLRAMPKVELHVHLEGSFTAERIAHLAKQAGLSQSLGTSYLGGIAPDSQANTHMGALAGGPPRHIGSRTPQAISSMDLASFLRRLDQWCALVRTPEQAEEQAYGFASFLRSEGIVYAEVTVNPVHWAGLTRQVLLEAVDAGFARAAGEKLTDCKIVVSLGRSQSLEEARALLDELSTCRPARVVGLGIDGNEEEAPGSSSKLSSIFRSARDIGLGLTAHAGESSGPQGVRDALDLLGVSRIDHGVRAVEDADLLRRLADESVTLNICPTSNAVLLYGDIMAHPVAAIVAARVPVTINTDDPMVFSTTLAHELKIASALCGWDYQSILQAQLRAAASAFNPSEAHRILVQSLGPGGSTQETAIQPQGQPDPWGGPPEHSAVTGSATSFLKEG